MSDLKLVAYRDIKTEPVTWLWEPYIPFGKITLVQGDPGEGKSMMMAAIAAAVTRGDALPNGKAVVPADVIFQNAEDDPNDTTKARLESFNADMGRIHFINEDERELSFSDERIEESIIKSGAKLFVFDPMQAYFSGANMNSANGVRPLFKKLSAIASRTGCAFVLIRHHGKKGGSQYRGLGSVDIQAAARSVLTVGRIDVDENMRAIVHSKSNLAPPGASLAFGLDPVSGFCWLGEYDISLDELLHKKQKPPENQFARACNLIKTTLSKGTVAAVDIMLMAEEKGISEKTLKRAKSALGVISVSRGRHWYWEIPIEVEYAEAGQKEGREGQAPVTSLTLLA